MRGPSRAPGLVGLAPAQPPPPVPASPAVALGCTNMRPAGRFIVLTLALTWLANFSVLTGSSALAARPSPTPSPSPTATVVTTPKTKPSGGGGGAPQSTPVPSLPAPGTLPAGSTRTNPLPSSPTAPALITVDPSTIDPSIENDLNIFGRNLSADTIVQVDTVPATILQAPDVWHLIVSIPAKRLSEGAHDIVLTNPDGQFDDAMGALTARAPQSNTLLYLVVAGLVGAGFALIRFYRWLIR